MDQATTGLIAAFIFGCCAGVVVRAKTVFLAGLAIFALDIAGLVISGLSNNQDNAMIFGVAGMSIPFFIAAACIGAFMANEVFRKE